MDKLEYIPGDLVFAYGKLCKVVGYSFEDNDLIRVYEYRYGSFDDTVSIASISQEVRGIPITEKILKANDRLIHYLARDKMYMIGYIALYPDIDDYRNRIFNVCVYGERVMPPIQYVHQLQHLLFGLGLNSEMEV